MGKRSPAHVLWTEGPSAFSFLVDEHGFTGPHVVEPGGLGRHGGLRYSRAHLTIEMEMWEWHRERGFYTRVRMNEPPVQAGLSDLFEALGLGPPQAVPESGGSGQVVRKRIAEHASALRRVVPHLADPDLRLSVWRRPAP